MSWEAGHGGRDRGQRGGRHHVRRRDIEPLRVKDIGRRIDDASRRSRGTV